MSSSSSRAVSMRIGTRAGGPNPPAHLEAVELRQHQVEDDEVDAVRGEPVERFLSVARLDDAEAVTLERKGQQLLDRVLVVDEENRGRICHSSGACVPAARPGPTIAPACQRFPARDGGAPRAEHAFRPSLRGRSRRATRSRCWRCFWPRSCHRGRRCCPRRRRRASTAPRRWRRRASSRPSYPDRSPGSPGAAASADWVAAAPRGLGYTVHRDRFRAAAPGAGDLQLENLTALVRGRTGQAIVVIARARQRRQRAGRDLQRLRHRRPARARPALRPRPGRGRRHAHAHAHAHLRVARRRRLRQPRRRAHGEPRRLRRADVWRSSTSLQSGARAARGSTSPAAGRARPRRRWWRRPTPGRARQPDARPGTRVLPASCSTSPSRFSYYDHAPFVERRIPAVTLTTAGVRPPEPFGDGPERLSSLRMAQLGASAQALVDSLDAGGLELEPGPVELPVPRPTHRPRLGGRRGPRGAAAPVRNRADPAAALLPPGTCPARARGCEASCGGPASGSSWASPSGSSR